MKTTKEKIYEQLYRRQNEDAFILYVGELEILCEKSYLTGNLIVYHPTNPIYETIPNWAWNIKKILELLQLLKKWGIIE